MEIQEIVVKLMSDKESLDYCVRVTRMNKSKRSVICESDIRVKKILTEKEQNFLEKNTEEISDIFRKIMVPEAFVIPKPLDDWSEERRMYQKAKEEIYTPSDLFSIFPEKWMEEFTKDTGLTKEEALKKLKEFSKLLEKIKNK